VATGATVSSAAVAGDDAFLESLTESSLYSIGASFCDRSPDLVDDLLEQGTAIERAGLAAWAEREGVSFETAFRTLVTGLGVRYYTAVVGAG
jgi:hypothetical protein